MGVCYAINSVQVRDKSTERLAMVSNIKSGPGKLYLEINGAANVYILGEQEVPSMTTLTTDVIQVTPRIKYRRFLAVKEIDNQPEVSVGPPFCYALLLFQVKDVSIRQRKCRFSDESDLNVYRYYSYSACCVQCRKDAQLKICNCAHHLMPNTGNFNVFY